MAYEEKKEVIAEGKLKYTEFKKYTKIHQKRSLLFYFIFLFLAATSILFYVLYDTEDFTYVLLFSSVLALTITIIMTGMLFVVLRVKSSREYKSDWILKKEVFYTISKTGIYQKIGKSHSLIEWKSILYVREHKDLFLIYLTKRAALILPKRYFESNEDVGCFKNMINKNLDTKKNKLN